MTSNEYLESRFITKQWKEIKDDSFPDIRAIFINSVVKNAVERYIHLYDSFEYNEDKASDIIYEIQKKALKDKYKTGKND